MQDDIRKTLVSELAGRGDVELALLFGSRARGDARADSDVDLAVAGTHGARPDVLDLMDVLTRACGVDVDVVVLADASIPLLEALLRDSIVVHEARPGVAAAWRSRTLLAMELDRPWYARMRDAWLARVASGEP